MPYSRYEYTPSLTGPSVFSRIPESVATWVEFAPEWVHVSDVTLPSAPSGKAARRAAEKMRQVFKYLGLSGQVLNESLLRSPGGNSLRVCPAVEFGPNRYNWFCKGDLPKLAELKYFRRVNLVSGSCLYSARAVRVETPGGLYDMVGRAGTGGLQESVISITCEPDLTFYEIEAARRLVSTIVKVAQGVMMTPTITVQVVLDVPRTQYYLYAQEGALNGFITTQQALAWCDDVDRRSRRVVDLCRQLLRVALGGAYAQIKVTVKDQLEDVATFVRERFQDGGVPTLAELVAVKKKHASQAWTMLLSLGDPTSIQEFNGRSYSAALLEGSFSQTPSDAPCLAVEIDNLSEGKIMLGVQDAGKAHPGVAINAIALYPVEHFYPKGKNGLYQNDPGAVLCDVNGLPISAETMLDEIYP